MSLPGSSRGALPFLPVFLVVAGTLGVSPALSYHHRESFPGIHRKAKRGDRGCWGSGERAHSEWYGLFYSRNRAEILLTEAFLSASDPQ